MMKKIRRSFSSFTLRAFCRNASNGGVSVPKVNRTRDCIVDLVEYFLCHCKRHLLPHQEGWFLQKSQESALIQCDPSMEDRFNIEAFYAGGQLDFPNQVPGNVLKLYHELFDMEQKVKALENEIAVYVMSVQNKGHPSMRRGGISVRRKPNNVPKKCCLPGLWSCARAPVTSETHQKNRTTSRPVNLRSNNKRNSVSTAAQTASSDNRSSRLSKVSWNSKVDVRYIGSGIQSEKAQRAPLQAAEPQPNPNNDMKNVVHLKIKIPKDVLNLTKDGVGRISKRLENEWNQFNSSESENKSGNQTSITNRIPNVDAAELVTPAPTQTVQNPNCSRKHCPTENSSESKRPLTLSNDTHSVGQMVMVEDIRTNENAIVSTSIVQKKRKESTQTVGIPVKQPGRPVCESQGCTCMGSSRNDENLEKVRQSFDMTESELSLLEEAVHSSALGPVELKIQTEYGSVNVISHDADCKCKICETFGSRDEPQRKRSGRSDSAAVISKKIIRVHYNGHYRNIITHTEECGCDICSSIEEHSYRLTRQRASIVSTHRGEVVVKNKGVCGCKNCKTVEMGPHVVDVGTMLSRTSSHVLDQCYYSEATIPSMQSFPMEGLTTTDDQGTSFSSPPSINSSDLSDDIYEQSPSASNYNVSDQVLDDHTRPNQNISELQQHGDEPERETNKNECTRCQNVGTSQVPKSTRNRILKFVKPSSAKSSPAGLDKNRKDNECQRCASCKNAKKAKEMNGEEKCKLNPVISRLSLNENQATPPLERDPLVDTRETINSNNCKVPINDRPRKDKKIPSYNADHITLEDLIKDLIRGQPGRKKDKVYTVTLGEVANRAYTKIHIIDCSAESDVTHKIETTTNGLPKEPVRLPNGDGSNSNVFFIKPLPSSIEASHIRSSTLPILCDGQNKVASTDNRSLSSPACIQGDTKPQQQPSHIEYPPEDGIVDNQSEGAQEANICRSASETSPQSDAPKKAFKLTISFGKKVASFFKQRGRKNTLSNHTLLSENEVPQNNPKCLKTFTIYEEEKQLKQMKLLQIDVKPRYFTLEANSGGTEATVPSKQAPILCLVEKNSNTQVIATVAT